jgi:hypothetical protein
MSSQHVKSILIEPHLVFIRGILLIRPSDDVVEDVSVLQFMKKLILRRAG